MRSEKLSSKTYSYLFLNEKYITYIKFIQKNVEKNSWK